MRILHWSQAYLPVIGGVELLTSNLMNALAERGHQNLLITTRFADHHPEQEEQAGISIRRLPFRQALSQKNPLQFMALRKSVERIKQEFRPDLVHMTFNDPSVLFHLMTDEARPIPLLVWLQEHLAPTAAQAETIAAKLMRRADWVVTCSLSVLHDARRLCPDLEQKSSCIMNACPPPDVAPTPLPWPPKILCLGRLNSVKGFDVAVRAMGRIATAAPDAELLIAGDGPERNNLEQLAIELGVQNLVTFLGPIPLGQTWNLLNRATLIMMPSRWDEAFGLVALEAALMGRPIIASRAGGLPEVVLDGETGWLRNKEDWQGFAEAAIHLINAREQTIAMGKAARVRASTTYRWDGFVDSYDGLYRRLVKAQNTVIS